MKDEDVVGAQTTIWSLLHIHRDWLIPNPNNVVFRKSRETADPCRGQVLFASMFSTPLYSDYSDWYYLRLRPNERFSGTDTLALVLSCIDKSSIWSECKNMHLSPLQQPPLVWWNLQATDARFAFWRALRSCLRMLGSSSMEASALELSFERCSIHFSFFFVSSSTARAFAMKRNHLGYPWNSVKCTSRSWQESNSFSHTKHVNFRNPRSTAAEKYESWASWRCRSSRRSEGSVAWHSLHWKIWDSS